MNKSAILVIGIAFVLMIVGGIHAYVKDINPLDSPFRWWIVGYFVIAIIYLLINKYIVKAFVR